MDSFQPRIGSLLHFVGDFVNEIPLIGINTKEFLNKQKLSYNLAQNPLISKDLEDVIDKGDERLAETISNLLNVTNVSYL